jgi:hypothetical protein
VNSHITALARKPGLERCVGEFRTKVQTMQVKSQAWWCSIVIPATLEAEVGGSWFKPSSGKISWRPYLKKIK